MNKIYVNYKKWNGNYSNCNYTANGLMKCKEDFEEWYKKHVSYVEYKIKKIIESYS